MNTARRLRYTVNYTLAKLMGEAGRYDRLPDAMAFTQLSQEEVEREQLRRLRALLAYAGTHVPYWRDLFAEKRFHPEDIDSISKLEALPILTKDIVRAETDRLIADGYEKEDLIVRKTGGSTAEPLIFYASREDYEAQMSLHLRSMALAGAWPGDKEVKLWGYNQPWQWGNVLAPLTGRLYLDAYHLAPAMLDRWLWALRRFRPKSIYGYAGALHQLARHAADRRTHIPDLEVVFSTAEKLFPEQRHEIEATLGVQVIDLYGSHEVPRLASECLHGNMHAAPDAAVLEFIEQPGEAPPKMLVTSLQSWAMPFIRYDQGDVVRPVEGTCPCGLPFPLVSMEVGKVHHVFALPGGRRIHSGYFHKPVFKIEAVRAFQIRHLQLDRVEIVAVPRSQRAKESDAALAAVCKDLTAGLEGTVQVSHQLVEDIPKTPRGKQPIVVSHVEADRQ